MKTPVECSESLLDTREVSDPDEEIHFICTQMQSKHEEAVKQEKLASKRSGIITKMQSYKLSGEVDLKNSSVSTNNATNGVKNPRKPKRNRSLKSSKPKAKSMSAMVREKYDNPLGLPYFSGDQTKIDEFLLKFSKCNDITKFHQRNYHLLYSKSEWNYILQCIKLKFPDLNSTTKKNLKLITRKIDQFEQIHENDSSVWSQASSHPECKLTDQELQWLYDLSDDQMVSNTSFAEDQPSDNANHIMILSQTMNKSEHVEDDNSETPVIEIILDSEPEPDILRRNDIRNAPSHQLESIFDPQTSFQSFPFAEVTLTSRKLNEPEDEPIHEVINSLTVPSPLGEEQIQGSMSPVIADTAHSTIEIPPSNSKQNSTNEENEVNQPNELKGMKVFNEYNEWLASSPQSDSVVSKSNLDDANVRNETSRATDFHDVIQSSVDVFKVADNVHKLDAAVLKRDLETSPFISPNKRTKLNLDKVNNLPSSYTINKTIKEQGSPIRIRHPPSAVVRGHSTVSNSSPIVSPLKPPRSPIQLIPNSSDLSDDEVMILSGESVYSTAKSSFRTQLETPIVAPSLSIKKLDEKPKKKLLNTTRYEIKSDINIKEFYDENTKIRVRNLGCKVITIDLENEVSDSEDDENSVSIIEITREVETEESGSDRNTSVLQVPSSPHSNRDVLADIITSSDDESTKENNDIDRPKWSPKKTTQDVNLVGELNKLNTKQLKQKFIEWELKPVRSRARMIEVLLEIAKLIVESSDIQGSQFNVTNLFQQCWTTEQVKNRIHERLNDLIRQELFWHEKIISYEPIRLIDLQQWFESTGVVLELDILRQYCDDQGIATRQ
jgi:structure-specific endonuclease subunit SLX4